MIKPIDTWSIDQITSGQVITNISNVVKELIENSIDAGASVIDVKLVNYGKDGIRIQDNGCGINEADFDLLAQKHATSKLEQFCDLGAVKTLGFRGEALASLCALSEVTIFTSVSGSYGYELKMGLDGSVREKTKTATPKGTVVVVDELFRNLPVRRKDFERNYMREYTKLISVIQEYALLTDARITVEHITRNRSNVSLRSQGSDMMQRIACIYGFKRTKTLLKVSLVPSDLNGVNVNVDGYISKPAIGMGDSATTCQLIAINGRPSYQPRIVKTLVDVYKQFNITETPFFVLNISMETDMYDVNISPDKRSLLLHGESKLIEALNLACVKVFGELDHPVPRSASELPPSKKTKSRFLSFANFASSGSLIEQNSSSKEAYSVESDCDDLEDPSMDITPNGDLPDRDDTKDNDDDNNDEDEDTFIDHSVAQSEDFQRNENHNCCSDSHTCNVDECAQVTMNRKRKSASNIVDVPSNDTGGDPLDKLGSSLIDIKQEIDSMPLHLREYSMNYNESESNLSERQSASRPGSRRLKTLNTHIHLPITSNDIADSLKTEANFHEDEDSNVKCQNLAIDEEGVEERLQLSIRKDDFEKMEIVGQFNLGFILVINHKANHDDLFVIDQHASDEIYNFERLQSNTVLSRQPLISPHQLELSAVEELTIQEHMDIFEKNGFSIGIHDDEPPGHQCFLESVPYSKSTIFDDRDVFELLSKIKEEPTNKELKCSKLRAMFAMRACRSSIMVGRSLDMNTMRRVVNHLGLLDKPWNCPHGRPTLRHITSLS